MDKLKDLASDATGGDNQQQQQGGGGGGFDDQQQQQQGGSSGGGGGGGGIQGGLEDRAVDQGVDKELGSLGVPASADGAINKEVNQEAGKFL